MKKIYKISKYFLVTAFVVLISSMVGQKHSSDYGFSIPEASADIPPGPSDGSCGASDGGAAADSGSSASDDGGTDGASADGPGDGACAA